MMDAVMFDAIVPKFASTYALRPVPWEDMQTGIDLALANYDWSTQNRDAMREQFVSAVQSICSQIY